MTEQKLQMVQEFLTQIDEDDAAKQRFESLAKAGDVQGFEKWVEDSGCDPQIVGALMPDEEMPEGELSDDDLEGVAGGAIRIGWFTQIRASARPKVEVTARTDMLSSKIGKTWARWVKINNPMR